MSNRDRDRREAKVSEEQTAEEQVDGEWVGSSLISAMDRMELHVDEMLNTEPQPVPPHVAASMNSSTHSTAIKDLIHQEITHIVDRKISAMVDAAITARFGRPTATNLTSNSAGFTAQDRRILRDLDVLHHHEADLNKKLVERLFQVDAPTRERPEQRFARTTAGLEGTDSVTSVLVSHVEALVAKVEGLQKRVTELELALREQGDGLPY
jgi:hypothetical protein